MPNPKNIRTIGLTLNLVLLITLVFSIFKDHQIDALNIIALVTAIVNLIYFIFNKPHEQIPGTAPETKQN